MVARQETFRRWEKRLVGAGINPRLSDAYLRHIGVMLERDVPVILDFGHLSGLLGRTTAYMASVVNGSASHYREFDIPKRRRGQRRICAPYPALYECQRWILDQILSRIEPHKATHGFRQGRSIVTNAKPHLGTRTTVCLDLENFFPSISIRRVVRVFQL